MTVSVGRRWRVPGDTVLRRQASVGLGIIAARACGFAAGAIVARALGPHGFGHYTLAFTMFTSLLQLTSFADTWLVSRWGPAESRPAILAVVWRAKRDSLLAIICVSGATAAVAALSGGAASQAVVAILVGSLAAALGSLPTALAAFAQAEGRFGLYTLAVSGPPALVLVLTALAALTPRWRFSAFLIALAASYVPFAWYAVRVFRRRVGPLLPGLSRDLLSFGGWVTLGTVFYAVFQRIDIFLLGAFRSVSDVGQYGAAVRLSGIGALGASIVGAALMPIGSRAATWTEAASRGRYLEESALAAIGVVTLLGVVILIAPWLIPGVFGDDYAAATGATQILLLGQLILGVQQPFYFALYALDGRRWIAGIGLAQLGVALIAGAGLSHSFGLVGAAWSNTLTHVTGTIGIAFFLVPRLRRSAVAKCAAR